MKRFFVLMFFAICLLQAPYALAYSVAFEDNANYWEGFGNDHYTYSWGTGWTAQNESDVIGTPDLTGGNFVYDGHTLVGIELNYASTSREVMPGDWFFDFNQDNVWDYVLHNDIKRYCWGGISYSYQLYSVSLGYGDKASEDWTDEYRKSYWPWGYEGRYDHPVQALIDEGAEGEDVAFSGWQYWRVSEDHPGLSVWSGIDLDLSKYSNDSFTYGFAMTCANDVLYGESLVPAPEPSTFLLLGFGGLGLLFYGRKRRRSL